jgi:Lrp/AsnC family transcriptional regulator, leucine-responsive regulatory protein
MLQSSRHLDEIDTAVLDILQKNNRMTNAELARQVNLSPPAVHARVKRLEREGYIDGHVALLNRERAGYDLLCFVQVSLMVHQFDQVRQFREIVVGLPEVLECHHVTGEFDYLLKVTLRNRADLERFVVNELTPLPGVARIYTSLVLTEVKVKTQIPLSSAA